MEKQSQYWVICPDYPPSQSGLAGHTVAFAQALRKHGSVKVLTSAGSVPASADLFPVVKKWNFSGLVSAFYATPELRDDKTARIVVQYLPFLYNPRGGINFSICFFALFLFLSGRKIDLICHELHYPFLPQPKAIALFSAHISMLVLLGIASDQVFTTTDFFLARARKILFWKKNIFYLPVGSNMGSASSAEDAYQKFRKRFELDGKFVISIFGTIHPTREMKKIISSLVRIQEKMQAPSVLMLIGETEARIKSELGEQGFLRFLSRGIILGKIESADFAAAMRATHIAVAFFSDGATTRRGSLLASASFGVPTVSTLASHTEPSLRDLPELTLLSPNPEKFVNELEAHLHSKLELAAPALRSPSNYYRAHFGWEQIITRYREAHSRQQ